VIEIDSTYADALGNLGAIHHNKGELKTAISFYERALKYNASNTNIYNNIIKAYSGIGDTLTANQYKLKAQGLIQ
jgi:tetratricopeptide (TPR) repeat protein